MCVNTEILIEYEEILTKKTTKEIAHNVVEAIARLHTTQFQETYIHFDLIEQDVDDNKFVDCAIIANSDYIVSDDRHFKVLETIPFPHVDVIKLHDFANSFV